MASGAATDGEPLVVDDDPLVELHAALAASRMRRANRVQRNFMETLQTLGKAAARGAKTVLERTLEVNDYQRLKAIRDGFFSKLIAELRLPLQCGPCAASSGPRLSRSPPSRACSSSSACSARPIRSTKDSPPRISPTCRGRRRRCDRSSSACRPPT